ncbi:MAG: pyrroline-5-carboxylate reductase dimerization domain-containing protein, partial [Spirochaetales bacterium]
FSQSPLTLIAVKPQDARSLLEEIAPFSEGKGFISLMAGKTLAFLQQYLKTALLCRYMPNLAAMYGKAAIGVSFPVNLEDVGFKSTCREIAQAVGLPLEIPETLMPTITGLSGSGIAFVFHYIHALALGGVKTGLPYPTALQTVLQVMEGAIEVLRKTGDPPSTWLTRVTSPAGTTIEGLQVLEEASVTAAVLGAVEAASRRAQELEGV